MMNVKLDEKQTGKNIKFYRKQRGWTMKELTKRAGVELVGQYENGLVVINFYDIIQIANALNVHPEWLMSWKQERVE